MEFDHQRVWLSERICAILRFLDIERFQGENVSEDVDETPQKDPRPKLQKKATFQELDAPQEDASLPKNYHVDWSQPSYAATSGPQRLGDQGTV